jgi:hypothetical protein
VVPSGGDVTFDASADHSAVTSYEARIYTYPAGTLVTSVNLGKPTPSGGLITVNLANAFSALTAGNYDVTIAAIGAGGTSESVYSNAFALPLV